MQRVLITAGASGIGRAMAHAFEAGGAQVWVTDVNADWLAACPATWRRDHVDATDDAAMSDLFKRVGEEWGGLDVLCANAGTSGPAALVEEQDPAEFHRCLAVNLGGAFNAARGALPFMKDAGKGCIVFTGSTTGLFGCPYRSPYVAAKWAINGLMKTVAMEAGPHGVRANVIAPGCVEGPRIDGVIEREAKAKGTTPEHIRDSYKAGTSLKVFARAEDVASMAVYLASEAGSRISGQILTIDGHTENPDPKV